MQLQIVEESEVATLEEWFIPGKLDPELRFDHAVLIFVADAHHQRRLSIQGRNHHRPAKHNPGDWSRKAHKNEAGHHSDQKYARHDFDHADDVAINGLRIHVAVADSRKRLNAEEEAIQQPFRSRRAANAVGVETVKKSENKI